MALEFDNILKLRILSSVIMVPIILLVIYMGGVIYNIMILIVAIICAFEWCNIVTKENIELNERNKWLYSGIIYIVLPLISLIYLRDLTLGLYYILFLCLTVWSTDIAAYFAGKIIGGPKIAVSISPNKTWAGLAGGVLAAGIVNIIIAFIYDNNIFDLFLFGSFIAILSQVGDFFESAVKRRFQVKDSGTIIPGHGGILDRIDGLMFTAPLIATIALISDGRINLWM